ARDHQHPVADGEDLVGIIVLVVVQVGIEAAQVLAVEREHRRPRADLRDVPGERRHILGGLPGPGGSEKPGGNDDEEGGANSYDHAGSPSCSATRTIDQPEGPAKANSHFLISFAVTSGPSPRPALRKIARWLARRVPRPIMTSADGSARRAS